MHETFPTPQRSRLAGVGHNQPYPLIIKLTLVQHTPSCLAITVSCCACIKAQGASFSSEVNLSLSLSLSLSFLLCFSVKHAMIVTEYMENGALDKYLRVRFAVMNNDDISLVDCTLYLSDMLCNASTYLATLIRLPSLFWACRIYRRTFSNM